MTTATPLWGTPTAMTITLAALASDTNLVAGRASTAIDFTSLDAIDVMVGGKITLGTGPTAGRQFEVWAAGCYDGTEFSGGASGTDGNLTPDNKALMELLGIWDTAATTDKAYRWGPKSLLQAFGSLPVKGVIYIVHNTGVALNSTGGNHELYYTSVKYESN